jgi:hypothetical protein
VGTADHGQLRPFDLSEESFDYQVSTEEELGISDIERSEPGIRIAWRRTHGGTEKCVRCNWFRWLPVYRRIDDRQLSLSTRQKYRDYG